MEAQLAGRPYKARDIAEAAMRDFVYEYDPRRHILPKDLNPADVANFLRQQIGAGNLTPASANQIVELADFYNLRGLEPDFFAVLQRQEYTAEQFLISLAFTRGIGILGGELFERGLGYYRYLLGLHYGRAYLPELLRCYSEYSLTLPPDAVSLAIKAHLAQLERDARNDPNAETQFRELEDLHNNILPRVVHAAEIKRRIMNNQNIQERLDQLVNIYLNLHTHYREWLERWAVRQLLREFRALGSEELERAYRRGMSRVQTAVPAEEAQQAIGASCLRAIQFFGGQLTPLEVNQARALPANLAGLLTLE